jgi:hypothetical protein
MSIKKSKYSSSFTAGSLLFNEINSILDILRFSDIEKEKKKIISENLFRLNSESSRKRILTEVKKRVKSIDKRLWDHYYHSDDKERKVLLFYIILKSHSLMFDFHSEVVLEKFRTLDLELSKDNVEIFLVKKSADHQEIEAWSNSTREKVKNTILLILTQANFLKDNKIILLNLKRNFWTEFITYGDEWFLELTFLKKSERENILGAIYETS